MTIKKVKYLFMMLIIVMGVAMSQAVTVNNFSFEDDGVLDPGVPTGWSHNNAGVDIGVDTGGSQLPSDGSYFLWQGNGSILSQTTGVVIGAAGASYTLTVDVFNTWNANPQIILYYDDAGTPVQLGEAHYLASDFPDSGTWLDMHELELTAVTTAASVGKNLGITLSIENYPGSVWAHYDNVRLVNNTVVLISPEDTDNYLPLDEDLEWSVAPTVDTIDLYFGAET